ncbi:DUF3117 domain-containing protein [Rhodococcus hoagii]|nr:DUF3117 domain-containing protein [Prescottella equi]
MEGAEDGGHEARTGDGPLEATKEGRGIVMRVPLEGGGRLVVELTPEEAAALGDESRVSPADRCIPPRCLGRVGSRLSVRQPGRCLCGDRRAVARTMDLAERARRYRCWRM